MKEYFEAVLLFKLWEAVAAPGSSCCLGYRPLPAPWCSLLVSGQGSAWLSKGYREALFSRNSFFHSWVHPCRIADGLH